MSHLHVQLTRLMLRVFTRSRCSPALRRSVGPQIRPERFYTQAERISDVDKTRKVLKWRSMERGMVENELILRKYAEAELPTMSEQKLEHYGKFLDEIDPDMYRWISGQEPFPSEYAELGTEIRKVANEFRAKQ